MGAIAAAGRPGVAAPGGVSIPGIAFMSSGFGGEAAGTMPGMGAMVSGGLLAGTVGGGEGAGSTPGLGAIA